MKNSLAVTSGIEIFQSFRHTNHSGGAFIVFFQNASAWNEIRCQKAHALTTNPSASEDTLEVSLECKYA